MKEGRRGKFGECITLRGLQLQAGGQGDILVLPHIVGSGAGMATVKELCYLRNLLECGSVVFPACRQPGMVAGTELDDLIVFWMRC